MTKDEEAGAPREEAHVEGAGSEERDASAEHEGAPSAEIAEEGEPESDEPARDQAEDGPSDDESGEEVAEGEPADDAQSDEDAEAEPSDEAPGDERGEDPAEGESSDDDQADGDAGDEPSGEAPGDQPVEDVAQDEPAEEPTEDEPTKDKPSDEASRDQPAEDSAQDEPAEDQPAEDQPAEDEPAEGERPKDEAAGAEATEDEPEADQTDEPEETSELAATQVLPVTDPPSPAASTTAASTPAVAPPARPSTPERSSVLGTARTKQPQEPRPAEPAHPLDAFAGAEKPRRRTGRVLGAIAAVLVVVAGAYVAASWALADRVPRGVVVAGVDIGGQDADVAVATLTEELGSLSREPIVVTAGERSVTVDPTQSGLTFDADATVAGLTGFTLEPARLWQHLFGLGEQPPVTQVDRVLLGESVAAAATALFTEPVDGRVVFADGAPHATPAQDGVAVDEDAASELLATAWLTAPRPIELPTVAVAPAITQEETDRAMNQLAKPLASGPVGVVVEDQVAELPADVVTDAATIVADGATLRLELDGEMLVEEILKRTRDLLSDAEDAHFEFVDGKPEIIPGKAGTRLDPEHVATTVRNAALGSPRTANIVLSETDPEQTTKALEELGITELVSVFDTPVTNDAARTGNLVRGAELVTGVLVRPGEVFSLNETIGPITAENGYVNSTVVVNGVVQQGMGGGLSQMGTTMFNAAYFAGFEDVEHRPHSYWFSRYPEGREATIYEGVLDVKWRNTTPYGALLNSYVKGGRLYVEVWGTKHFEVETIKSPRSRVTPPTTRYNTQSGCTPQSAGNPGFEVTNTRILRLDGEEVERTSYTWRYNPQDAIVCGPEPKDDD